MLLNVYDSAIEITSVNLTGTSNMVTLKNDKRVVTFDFKGARIKNDLDLLNKLRSFIIDSIDNNRSSRDDLYYLFNVNNLGILEEFLEEVEYRLNK